MSKGIRIYVHGVKDGKRWRVRYNYPEHYSLSQCLAKSGVKAANTSRVKGVGFEDGAMALHVAG